MVKKRSYSTPAVKQLLGAKYSKATEVCNSMMKQCDKVCQISRDSKQIECTAVVKKDNGVCVAPDVLVPLTFKS